MEPSQFEKKEGEVPLDDLQKEIGRRQKLAVTSGVAEAFIELYFDSWKDLPSRIHGPNAGKLCHPLITEAKEDRANGRLELRINGHECLIGIKEHAPFFSDDTTDSYMDFELSIDGALMLGLTVEMKFGLYEDKRSLCSVTAFIPGPWVNEILWIAKETKARKSATNEELRAALLRDQAKRFGL